MAARPLTAVLSRPAFLRLCQSSSRVPACLSVAASCKVVHIHLFSNLATCSVTPQLSSAHRTHQHGMHVTCGSSLPSTGRLCPPVIQASLPWCVVRGYAKKVKKEKVVKGGKKKVTLSAQELEGVLDLPQMQEDMKTVAEDLRQQMIQQVSIRTNIGAFDNLPIKTEDGVFPLIQLGQVVQKNPTLILVNMASAPQYLKAVKEALSQSGLNVNPQQDGTTIFIPVPKVTREHREGLAKNAKMIHDKAKTRLRDIHNKYVKTVKSAKDSHSEDIIRAAQDLVLQEMHTYGHQLDALLTAKQQELLGGK